MATTLSLPAQLPSPPRSLLDPLPTLSSIQSPPVPSRALPTLPPATTAGDDDRRPAATSGGGSDEGRAAAACYRSAASGSGATDPRAGGEQRDGDPGRDDGDPRAAAGRAATTSGRAAATAVGWPRRRGGHAAFCNFFFLLRAGRRAA
uniref:Uncharacterized protein n=1 Tax=Leersia perrieri TaxID=77586 RepID=A0A0D9X9X9_9ORYZ